MGQLRDLKLARRPPRLRTLTDIEAPSVRKERVNGKDRYIKTDAKPGVITIYSDDEDDKDHPSRSRAVKLERSQIPPRAGAHGHKARIKQLSPDRLGQEQSCGQTSSAAAASVTRQNQTHEPLRGSGYHATSDPPNDSSPSSDSSGSDSSDSSESEAESDSSSDSSSSDGSSSGDEASASVYRPSTPASSIGPSPPRTRRNNKEAGVQASSANPEVASPSRQSWQSRASIDPGHAPLDFFIPVTARSSSSRPGQAGRSRSQTSSVVAPRGVQTDRSAHPNSRRPNNSSPVVLGFMPINREPPPKNAPTEPRAMRTGDARPVGLPVRAPQRPSLTVSEPVSGPSSLPVRALQPVKDKFQQKDQQRRGPARPGRIMQTIEQAPAELLSASSPPKKGIPSSHMRPATPGPSSRRTALPRPSPGIFVTPRAVSVRPHFAPRRSDGPQSASRSERKRTFDETEDVDPASKAEEWERVLEKIKNHEKEMEQQRALLEKIRRQEKEMEQQRAQDRAQLEETKRLLAEQKTRIDDLEQRRAAEELVRDPGVRTQSKERDVSAPSEAAPQDVVLTPESVRRRVAHRQSESREGRKGRNASRVARARLREQERQQIEQDRQEELELEHQLEQEQRREAERLQRVVRRAQDNGQRAPAQVRPETEAEAQRRIQHEIFTRPLSGHNPQIEFDDYDLPYISHATAFLMRLPQAFVLRKLRKLVEGKTFFDVAHPGRVYMGCWVVSKRASCDMRMKLVESGEKHGFSFARLAVRLWHDEQSIYKFIEHDKHQLKAINTCHTERCIHPDHIVVEPSSAAGERRRCKNRGRCYGHATVGKDGSRQARRPCIFPP